MDQPPNPPSKTAAPPSTASQQATPNSSTPDLSHIESGYLSYLKKRWWAVIIIVLLALVIGVVNIIFGIVIVAIAITYTKLFYDNELFKSFAVSNNFSYQKKGSLENQNGLPFSVGWGHQFKDIVSGTYAQWPFQLFVYIYRIGAGRSQRTYHRAVMSVNYSTQMPAFVLRKHSFLGLVEEEGESLRSHGYTSEVSLEGDFSNHMRLYIRPNTQDDVLSIVTPDVMEILLKLEKFEIELTDTGVLYIYYHGYISNKQDLVDTYSILEALTTKISRYVNRQRELRSTSTQQPSTTATAQQV